MICPKCNQPETRVLDSRDTDSNRAVRRRRECEHCHHRFTTFERIEMTHFMIVKKDGARESYDRQKLERGILTACEKRKVTSEQISKMISALEEEWMNLGQKEVSSTQIGESVMEALKGIDEVAYIRFASVYRQFKDIETFKRELQKLQK